MRSSASIDRRSAPARRSGRCRARWPSRGLRAPPGWPWPPGSGRSGCRRRRWTSSRMRPSGPRLVELGLRRRRTPRCPSTSGKKSRKVCRSSAVGGVRAQLGLPVFGPLPERLGSSCVAVERHSAGRRGCPRSGSACRRRSPIAVLRATRASRSALRARIRSTRALATSTSARATSDFGRVPTSKKPRAERRFSSARSSACSLHADEPLARRAMFVYASLTASVISWRCSSTSSSATSASLRAPRRWPRGSCRSRRGAARARPGPTNVSPNSRWSS